MHLQLRRDNNDTKDRRSIPPASPEVISSLITSLSAIAQPASKHFDDPTLAIPSPVSPMEGGFGVEYGAYMHALDRLQEEDDLNDLAASPPVIRTSKPPSGFSPITAPKSPRRESSSLGLKSLLRSRPSSKGSASSSHEDTPSIGNLSIERGSPAPPDIRKPSSQDSWTTKLGRGQKGLMYMSSRERLRASESEKKRSGTGGLASKSSNLSNSSRMPDQILAETVISEEPTIPDSDDIAPNHGPSADAVHHLRPIPLRDSSLRSGRSAKRSSRKSSRQRSEGATAKSTPDDHGRSESKNRQTHRQPSDAEMERRHEDILMKGVIDPSQGNSTKARSPRSPNFTYEKAATGQPLEAPGIDDGAPSPAIYQNRRHSSQSGDRRKSGRGTPDPTAEIRAKRSSSGLKRLSAGVKSPDSATDNTKDAIMSDPLVGYERPGSADSIDDAVESYLCASRLSQKIRHPQTGRIISFSEVGDPEGSAVFCCVGMGLTRYITAFYDELGVALKLRLITPDRPGVGDSEAHDGTATPLSWPGTCAAHSSNSGLLTMN